MTRSDWTLFRRCVPEWRERYLARVNRELAALLTREGETPTASFWETRERIEHEARTLTDCFDGHSRSRLTWFLSLMHRHGVIDDADLAEFSEALQTEMRRALE